MADNRVADNRVVDNRVADNRVADNRVADNRVADNRVADNRVADNRGFTVCAKCTTVSNYVCTGPVRVLFLFQASANKSEPAKSSFKLFAKRAATYQQKNLGFTPNAFVAGWLLWFVSNIPEEPKNGTLKKLRLQNSIICKQHI